MAFTESFRLENAKNLKSKNLALILSNSSYGSSDFNAEKMIPYQSFNYLKASATGNLLLNNNTYDISDVNTDVVYLTFIIKDTVKVNKHLTVVELDKPLEQTVSSLTGFTVKQAVYMSERFFGNSSSVVLQYIFKF